MNMKRVVTGQERGDQKVLEILDLSNGWQLSKWTGTKKTKKPKSPNDFVVKVISPDHPLGFAITHRHFAIDFYGKLCQENNKGLLLLKAMEKLWHSQDADAVLQKYQQQLRGLVGYGLEYFMKSLNWILEQEDINFAGRTPKKQTELDKKIQAHGFTVPQGREGSQLAIAMFCDIASGVHPVEAFYSAGL